MATLEERIQKLEDIEAIKKLKARYLHACDIKDTAAIRSCFTIDNAVIDYGPIGKFNHVDELIAVFKELACATNVIDAHHGMNPQIERHDTDEATGTWDLYFHQLNPDENRSTQLTGYYHDRYRKLDGEWKIIETEFKVSSSIVKDA